MSEKTKCMNCHGEGEIRAVDSPNDHRYWVCEDCEPLVESGEARCVWRPNHV